ncbi:MAG: efflux RND transporter permease subunit [Candidatus Cloacimonetes bacterium]|nr:efflux RND transporter permease subunit [Candidatus Cloacimonadota bacterium]MCF7813593.1 efflux RND transporter permease subunit [Candidatus Cloacimonadota bacterium]MCF7867909.1 efflux RND transporter permease subunit [Candidatus Cloacimonadota bacterium]MCF7882898.1 efflux RND transporter permease subunit [Candidatus Cloacimonadota bacterium]
MSLAKFSVENGVLINMIMIIVFILGVMTLINMPKEEAPAVDFGAFYIMVSYRGVSPAEMEELVVKKIEDEISDLQDVDYITSTASEGRAIVYIQMDANADIDDAWDNLNTEMDKLNDLPADADDPYLLQLKMREVNEMCTVALGGDLSDNALRELADDFKEEVLDVDYVSKVEIAGTRDRQIWIDTNIQKLSQYGLTLNDLSTAVRMRNLNAPGGSIKVGYADFLIRTMGEFDNIDQISELVVTADRGGGVVRIGDVATVRDTLEEAQTISKLNTEKAVTVEVYKKADGNIISVMKDIREEAKEFEKRVDGLNVEVRNDGSIRVRNSVNTLGNNAIMGIILVFIVLWFFIGWKNALFAAWGIPFSFLLAFILMNQLDVTLNNLTLFGLILVLGMIVDDAIIVLENIHRYREMGLSTKEAAIKGTKEISWPVVAAVATTIAAFFPLMLLEGTIGKFFRYFPIVVSLALFGSLFESLIILPSHVVDLGGKKFHKKKNKTGKFYEWLVKKYQRNVKKALKYRGRTILILFTAMALAGLAVRLGLVKFQFFSSRLPQTLVINLETPPGTSLDKTDEVVTKIENFILDMPEKEDVDAVVTTIGKYRENFNDQYDTKNAEIKIDLVELDDIKFSHNQIKNRIRKYVDSLPELYTYTFKEGGRGGPPAGADIEIRVKGEDMTRLEEIGAYIISELEKIPGTADLETSFSEGKKEIRINPKHDKMALYGLNVQSISSLVGYASFGGYISKYRGTGMDEYDIVLRVKEEQIDKLEDLENLPIRTMNGDVIALKELADMEITTGYSQIQHRDRKRIITISGSVTSYEENGVKKMQTPDNVTNIMRGNKRLNLEGVLKDFSTRFPGYQVEFGGQAEQQSRTSSSLNFAFIVAILLVFTILATQFKSTVQPLIVMFTIPFALIGVIFGLVVTGLPFSMMTMISVVALAGVVVNDALVLVDFVNRQRAEGVDRWNSLINAGSIRLRPIIMTTVTTIAGFMPIILSTSSTTSDYKPMAVSIAFGLAFATVLTLFVIPVLYSLVDSLFGKLGMTRFKSHARYEDCVDCE